MTTKKEKETGHPSGARGEKRAEGGTSSVDIGLGGLFKGLGGFLELLSDLAEREDVIEKQGQVGDEKGVRAVYGLTMRVGAGGRPQVEPFGNVRRGRAGRTVVEPTREPIVDVVEEEGGIRVIAEMPGVEESDVHYELMDGVVTLRAARGDRRYEKKLELPSRVSREGAQSSFRNGIFELRLKAERPNV